MDDEIKNELDADCEEHSFCNCENNEQITPYLRDDCNCFDEEAEAVAEKCHQIKETCKDHIEDLKNDKKNPYFKQSWAFQTDIYKSINDASPTDRILMKNTYAISLRAIALIGGGIATLLLLKKIFAPKNNN